MPNTTLRLGDRLVAQGNITDEQLRLALRKQKKSGRLLGEALIELGFVDEHILAGIISSDSGTEFVDIAQTVCESEAIELMTMDMAKRGDCIPFAVDEEKGLISLAMANSLDLITLDKIERYTGYRVTPYSAVLHDIQDAIETYYSRHKNLEDTIDILLDANSDDVISVEDSPIVQLIENVLADAVRNRATDIHIEPQKKLLKIKYRVDGHMLERTLLPETTRESLTARVKILSGLDVSERNVGQDGRFSKQIGNSQIEFRVSTLPAAHGESIVIRVLNKDAIKMEMSSLGMPDRISSEVVSSLSSHHGIILVTGPTGSGKTTSLYTMIDTIDSGEKSVFTIENPVEYERNGIQQIAVNEATGLTFANVLTSMLRQDPDVIMVGEMRDLKTAKLALQAAQTGHLVLSTLHTNSAIGTINRLIDMGIEDYVIADNLLGVVSQRLVRKLCPHCLVERNADESMALLVSIGLKVPEIHKPLYKSKGCDKCNMKGISGRLGVYEYLKIDESFHDAIIGRKKSKIEEVAKENGFLSMMHDGLEKAFDGKVAIEDILAVSLDG